MTLLCDEAPVRDQESTGSCWAQAGLGLLQSFAAKRNMKVKLSVAHILFYDKYEKARVFLQRAIREKEPRRRYHLYMTPIDDGGTWSMFVNIVGQFGVVVDEAMPSTYQAKNTNELNKYLNRFLRAAVEPLQVKSLTIEDVLGQVREALVRCLGTRVDSCRLHNKPHEISWKGSPQELLDLIAPDISTWSVLAHAPDRQRGMYIGYASNNPSNETQDRFHVVRMREVIARAVDMLRHGTPVWFTADVAHDFSAKRGMAAVNLFNVEELLGLHILDAQKATTNPTANSKRHRLINMNSAPVHAMLLTGVRLDEDTHKPVAWRVQNSWGTDTVGQEGFIAVSHGWFCEYVFHLVDVKSRPFDLTEATHLPPWDVFATVA